MALRSENPNQKSDSQQSLKEKLVQMPESPVTNSNAGKPEIITTEELRSENPNQNPDSQKSLQEKLVQMPESPVGNSNAGKPEIITTEDMVERDTALLDSFICGFQRTTTLFFGRIVSNPADLPAFRDWLGYNMTYNRVPPGNGNALHKHNSLEIFVALDGPFEIGYGSEGQHKSVLQPMDLVACPAGVYHYYKNVGSTQAQILTILPGKPTVTWAAKVVEEARVKGADCDDSGVMKMAGASVSMVAPDFPEQVFEDGEMDPFVLRHQNKHAMVLTCDDGWIQVGFKDLEENDSVDVDMAELKGPAANMPSINVDDGISRDGLVIVLGGQVTLTGPSIDGTRLGRMDMFKLPGGKWTGNFKAERRSTLLIIRSKLPHHMDFFFAPTSGLSPCGQLPRRSMSGGCEAELK